MTVMMKLRLEQGQASLAAVASELGVAESDIDGDFGIVELDPDANVYAVMVDEEAAAGIQRRPAVQGPFANPPIEPSG